MTNSSIKSLFFTTSKVYEALREELCMIAGLDKLEVMLNPVHLDSLSCIPFVFVDDTKFEEVILPNIAQYKRKWIYLNTSEFVHENIVKAYPYSVLNMSLDSKSISNELEVIINSFKLDYL